MWHKLIFVINYLFFSIRNLDPSRQTNIFQAAFMVYKQKLKIHLSASNSFLVFFFSYTPWLFYTLKNILQILAWIPDNKWRYSDFQKFGTNPESVALCTFARKDLTNSHSIQRTGFQGTDPSSSTVVTFLYPWNQWHLLYLQHN